MASWQFHSLVFSSFIENNDVPHKYIEAFHLGCFAPDLVTVHTDKLSTHFVFGIPRVPFSYRIKKFKEVYSYNEVQDPTQMWFLRGYLLHLITDVYWCKYYLYAYYLRNVLKFGIGGKLLDNYYEQMCSIDAYYRNMHQDINHESVSIKLLKNTDISNMNALKVDFSKISEIIAVLNKNIDPSNSSFKEVYSNQVNKFLDKTLAVQLCDLL